MGDGRAPRLGRVVRFDHDKGWGEVASGEDVYYFHATAIADGSRNIDVGAKVAFVLRPALLGGIEARGLVKLAEAADKL